MQSVQQAYDPSTQGAETGGLLRVQGQHGLQSKPVLLNRKGRMEEEEQRRSEFVITLTMGKREEHWSLTVDTGEIA